MYSAYPYYGYDYGYGSSTADVTSILLVVAVIMAIAGTVLSLIFITPEKKREKLPKFLRIIHDIFNFNGLIIEKILKALYIFTTLYVILAGFFAIFSGSNLLVCLLVMVLGPVAVRIVYELAMMLVLLVKNVISINNKLKNQNEGEAEVNFEFDFASLKSDEPVAADAAVPVANEASDPAEPKVPSFCAKCGSQVNEEAAFCGICGAPINK